MKCHIKKIDNILNIKLEAENHDDEDYITLIELYGPIWFKKTILEALGDQ